MPATTPVSAATAAAHPRDLLAGHASAVVCMAVMVLGTFSSWTATVAAAGFVLALVWCLVRAVVGAARAAYVRLGVCCLAMTVMLVPAGRHPASQQMHAMTGAGGATAAPVDLALVGALVLVALTAVMAGRGSATRRAAGAGEGLLAVLMAAMLLGVGS